MIIPAIHYRLLGFVKKENGKIKMLPEGEYSNMILAYMPNGKRETIILTGNKKNITGEDVKKYLENKETLLIKSSTVKAVKAYMLTSRSYKKKIDEFEKQLIANGVNPEDEAKLDAEINIMVDKMARDYVVKNKKIKKDFILKSPLSRTKDGQLISRCIIFEEEEPSKSGLYVVSSSYDTWPVEITPIKNKEGEFVGFFKVQTNNLMSQGHWISLLEHYERTINEFIQKGKEVIAVNFNYDYYTAKELLQKNQIDYLKNLFSSLRNLTEQNKIPLKNKENYLAQLQTLKKIIKKEPRVAPVIHAEIMIIDHNFPEKNYEGKTLLSQLKRQAEIFVSLNYAKEPLEKQQKMLKLLEEKIEKFKTGQEGAVLATYNAPNEPIGLKTSWGFMDNNIQINHAILKPTKY